MELTLQELAHRIGATLVPADAVAVVTAVRPMDGAGPEHLSFASDERHQAAARAGMAGAILVKRPIEGVVRPQLVVTHVDTALIEAMGIFAPRLVPDPERGSIHGPHGSDVQIGRHCSIGPYVVIEDGVRIGDSTVITAGCRIGQNTEIGGHTRLDGNVVIYHLCRIGSHVIIQANSTIGSIGFGYAVIDGAPRLVPHNGGVIIEDFVEIGANCCIDRAKFTNTIVGAGTKLDNLVQVGHNVVIGKCCLIAAQVRGAHAARGAHRVQAALHHARARGQRVAPDPHGPRALDPEELPVQAREGARHHQGKRGMTSMQVQKSQQPEPVSIGRRIATRSRTSSITGEIRALGRARRGAGLPRRVVRLGGDLADPSAKTTLQVEQAEKVYSSWVARWDTTKKAVIEKDLLALYDGLANRPGAASPASTPGSCAR